MKKCTWCGKEYEDTASACAIDGTPLTSSESSAQEARLVARQDAPLRLKSKNTGMILAFVFCPIGLCYSTVLGAVILTPIAVFFAMISKGEPGFALILPFIMGISAVWAGRAVDAHNRKVRQNTTKVEIEQASHDT